MANTTLSNPQSPEQSWNKRSGQRRRIELSTDLPEIPRQSEGDNSTMPKDRSLNELRTRKRLSDRLLKTWLGTVLEIRDGVFIASLLDQTGTDPELQAEFFTSEVDDDDKSLLEVGAVFYWHLFQNVRPRGQVINTSSLRFRRTFYTHKDESWSRRFVDESEASGLFE
jgi:hypothetical protein